MRFTALPVHSFEDATLDLEQLQALGVLGSKIAGNVQVAVGTGTLTFTASDTSAVLSVAHTLGRTPQAVFATSTQFLMWFVITAPTASSFSVQGQVKSAGTGTSAFYWAAIG